VHGDRLDRSDVDDLVGVVVRQLLSDAGTEPPGNESVSGEVALAKLAGDDVDRSS